MKTNPSLRGALVATKQSYSQYHREKFCVRLCRSREAGRHFAQNARNDESQEAVANEP
jgi:hypothetical protein